MASALNNHGSQNDRGCDWILKKRLAEIDTGESRNVFASIASIDFTLFSKFKFGEDPISRVIVRNINVESEWLERNHKSALCSHLWNFPLRNSETVLRAKSSLAVKWHQHFLQNIELCSTFIKMADDRKLQMIYSNF